MKRTIACCFALCIACGGSSNGGNGNQCTAGAPCSPASGAVPCQSYATVCTGNVSSCVATTLSDGSACGTGNVCSAGACVAACVPSQSCTPAQADPCHTFHTSCNSTLTQASCVAGLAVPDDTECGDFQACFSGVCSPAGGRRVLGALQTVYLRDDGTREVRPGWDDSIALHATVSAIIAPSNADPSGYEVFPVTLAPDSSFIVEAVPFGPYFIQVDVPSERINTDQTFVATVDRTLYEVTTSSPDLSLVVSRRPDEAFGTQFFNVQVNLTGLSPVVAGDNLRLYSPENLLNVSFPQITSRSDFSPPPAPGATSISGTADWSRAFGVDPDASKGDVTWVWQRHSSPAPAGATLIDTVAFARVTDFAVVDGSGGTLTATLAPPSHSAPLPQVA